MDRLALLIGMAAGSFYIYTEMNKKEGEEETTTDDDDDDGGDTFQRLDRGLTYRLLKEAHKEVTDFDALTDADL